MRNQTVTLTYLKHAVERGLDRQEIAAETGLHPKTVSKLLLRHGLVTISGRTKEGLRRRQANIEKYQSILQQLYVVEQLPAVAVAAKLGVCEKSVQQWLLACGIDLRPRDHSGINNPNHKDGMFSQEYKRIVEKHFCERCGTTKDLVIHHKDHNHANNKRHNLEVLCNSCHSKHHNTGKTKKFCKRGHLLEQTKTANGKGQVVCRLCRQLRERIRYYGSKTIATKLPPEKVCSLEGQP